MFWISDFGIFARSYEVPWGSDPNVNTGCACVLYSSCVHSLSVILYGTFRAFAFLLWWVTWSQWESALPRSSVSLTLLSTVEQKPVLFIFILLISLSIMTMSSIMLLQTTGSHSFFLWPINILLCILHILFMHSWTDGHLEWFCILGNVTSAVTKYESAGISLI